VSRGSTQSPQNRQKNHVVIRFASLPDVVDAQIAQAAAGLKACATSIEVLDGNAERSLWLAQATELWDAPGAIVRASWLPAEITAAISELTGAAAGLTAPATTGLEACTTSLVGRAAIGAGHIRIDGDTAAQAAVVERLRASTVFGNVVIVRGSPELKAVVDVWGSHGTRQPLFDSLKRTFDPGGVLNAGRGPL
jgi:hypothetical protein